MNETARDRNRKHGKSRKVTLGVEQLESRLLLAAPVIQSLTDTPDPVNQGSNVVLTANNVIDPDGGNIVQVDFYRSADSVFDPGTDTIVGSDTSSAGGWSVQAPANWGAGLWYYFAEAEDSAGETSAAAVTTGTVNALPTVGSLTGDPDAVSPGDTLTLIAGGVADPDGLVNYVEFFHDTNNNGTWDAADEFLGRDTDGSNGWTWTGTVEWTVGDYFARASDDDGALGPFTTGHVDQRPTIAAVANDPNPIVQGEYVTFVASGVADTDSAVTSVLFYRDVFDSGHYNPVQDQLLGSGVDLGGGQWQLTVQATWDPDVSPVYFAVAEDTEGNVSEAVWTLNQNPSLDEVVNTPVTNAVDEQIVLDALGVADADGFIRNVVFSAWDPPADMPDYGSPTDGWTDFDGADGYNWEFTPSWAITALAQADFDLDGDLDVAATVDVTATLGPDMVVVLLNNGSGQFAADSLVPIGAPPAGNPYQQYEPTDLQVGDFDGDGYADIVTANSATDRISVLLNDGAGGFATETTYDLRWGSTDSIYPQALAVADLNGDGILDVAAAASRDDALADPLQGTEGAVAVLLGDGTGAFAINASYVLPGPGVAPEDIVAADLDQDGDVDLATVGFDGPLFLWNDGTGFFGDAGGVIGRATETGITGASDQHVIYGYRELGAAFTYRLGDTPVSIYAEEGPYYNPSIFGTDIDMYRLTGEEGQYLEITLHPVPYRPGVSDPISADIGLYDENGLLIAGIQMDEEVPDSNILIVPQLPETGNYYIGIGGLFGDPPFNPITGQYAGSPASEGEYGLEIRIGSATFDDSDTVILPEAVGEPWEPNEDFASAHSLNPVGTMNAWYGLSIDPAADEDWYSFTMGAAGTAADYVEILFTHADGDLDMALYDDGGVLQTTANSITDNETISLNGLAAGTWYVRVYGFGADVNDYDLMLHTPGGPANGIQGDLAFYDADADGLYDINDGEDVWADEDYANELLYNYGTDRQIWNPSDWNVAGLAEGITGDLYFYDASGNGVWDPGEFIWSEGSSNDAAYLAGTADDVGDTPVPVGSEIVALQGNIFFWDANENGFWEAGEDVWADLTGDDVYDLGLDTQVADNGDGWDVPDGSTGIHGRVFFGDADMDGDWSIGEGVWAESRTPSPDEPIGAGDSIVATNFLEDDWDNVPNELLDIDIATANSRNNRVTVLLGNHYMSGSNEIYAGLYPNQDRSADGFGTRSRYDDDTDLRITDNSRVYDSNAATYTYPFWDILGNGTDTQDNVYFYDINGNHTWDYGEGIWADQNGDNVYDDGIDTPIHNVDDWRVPDGTVGIQGNVYYYDEDSSGFWDPGEDLWADMHPGTYLTNGSPTDLVTYNIDADTTRQTYGTPGWWWAQGSVEAEEGDAAPRDPYMDLVTTNANGSLSIFLNEGGHSANFGVHEYMYTGDFDAPFSAYHITDYAFDGPFDSPGALLAGDFDGDGLANLVVGEKLNIATLNEADPYQTSNPLSLDPYDAEIAQAGLPFDFGGRYSVLPGYHAQMEVTYYARAHDNRYDPINNPEYEGYSATESLTVAYNQRPLIWTLNANRSDIDAGDTLVLTAKGVQDVDGFAASVAFYADGGDGVFNPTDPGTDDVLLGVDTDGGDGWSFSGPFDGDVSRIYWAQATDDQGTASRAKATFVNEAPSVAALQVDGIYRRVIAGHTNIDDDALVLDGGPVLAPGDHGVRGDVLFNDANFNGRWDPGEDLWQDGSAGVLSSNGVYDWEYDISDAAGLGAIVGNPVGTQGTYIFEDTNGDAKFNWAEEIWHDANSNGLYDAGETQIWDGGDGLWNTAADAAGISGNVYSSGTDIWADAGIDADGVYHAVQEIQVTDGSDGVWSTDDSVAGIIGNLLFRDDSADGSWDAGEPIWAEEVYEHDWLVLTAVDVRGGTNGAGSDVRSVQFYRDMNYNGIFEPETDQFLGYGVNMGDLAGFGTTDGDDWQFFIEDRDWVESPSFSSFFPTVEFSPGTQRFFAVAQDSNDYWSEEVSGRTHVRNIRPIISGLTGSPDPVTAGSSLTLTALGVGDAYGAVDHVAFYRDADANGILDQSVDQLIGTDGFGGDGWSLSAVVMWPSGNHRYFARVQDNYGEWSDDVAVFDGVVNGRPVFGGTFDVSDSETSATGAGPVAVAYGDFDDDDRIDLAVAESGAGTVSVLLGHGDGTFDARVPYAVGAAPSDVVATDLNGDGILDLVTANSGDGTVSVLLGVGDGTFSPQVAYAAGANPVAVAVGNADADQLGYPDIVVVNRSIGQVNVLPGTGLGMFGAPVAVAGFTAPADVAVGLVNGDSYLDLVVADAGAPGIWMLAGDGQGGFDAPVLQPTGGTSPDSLVLRDLDLDGRLDLAVSDSSGNNVTIMLGDGTGAFMPGAVLPVGNTPVAISSAYLDADTRPDLLVANSASGDVSVLLNNGGGEFAPTVNYAVGANPAVALAVVIGGDEAPDLFTAHPASGVEFWSGIEALADENSAGDYDPVDQGSTLVLETTGLRDPDGDAITLVQFYRDTNGNGSLNVGIDEQLDPDGVSFIGVQNGGLVYQWAGPVTWAVGDHTYFARAQDSRGGWSHSALQSGTVTNPPPVIVGGLQDSPDPVTQGYGLTLVAANVQDANGTIQQVEFYRDSNNNGALDLGTDEFLGVNTTAEGSDYSLMKVVDWDPGSALYFARAQDNDDAWSEVVSATGFVNGRPVVETLTPSPNPIPVNGTLTLTATGVYDTDPAGSVVRMQFYRDSNNNGKFDDGFDQVIGSDTVGGDGWSISFPVATDSLVYFARAQDDMGGWSFAATSAVVNRLPVVGQLNDSPDPITQGATIRLEASDVYDVDGQVDAVYFYRDANGNSLLDPAVDQLLGIDTTSGNGWAFLGPVTWTGGLHTYFAQARDNTGNFTRPEDSASTVGYVNRRPLVDSLMAAPDPVTRGASLTLTAVDATDLDGTVVGVQFYRDTNFNGVLDIGLDSLIGVGTNAGDIAGGADDDWTLTVATTGWEPQVQTLFVRAQDNSGSWGPVPATSGTVRVNNPPSVASLADNPDPVAQGMDLTLTALGVDDVDGTVVQVEFYRDTNGNGTFDLASDALLGTGTQVGATDWELAGVDTSGFPVGTVTYFARSQDDNGAWSTAVTGTGRVHLRPTVAGLTDTPDPVFKGNDLTLVAVDVVDPDALGVSLVRFYRDADGDDVLDPLIDELLGVGENIGNVSGGAGNEWRLIVGTAGWPAGDQTYFAIAYDVDGGESLSVQTDGVVVTTEPSLAGVTDNPDPVVRGEDLTLTAIDASDTDGVVTEVRFYYDSNANGTLETATDELLGTGTNVGDIGGGNEDEWQLVVPAGTTWPLGPTTYFAVPVDDDTAVGDEVSTIGEVGNHAPEIDGSLTAEWDPVAIGQDQTLTVNGVQDIEPAPFGGVVDVEFWRDLDGDGVFDDAVDELLGSGVDMGGGVWQLTVDTSGWSFNPDQVYFVRALDIDSDYSPVVSTAGEVNYTLIASRQIGDTWVSFYDMDPDNGVSAPEIAWGRNQRTSTMDIFVDTRQDLPFYIREIELLGNGAQTRDLGIVVSGLTGLRDFKDSRDLAFNAPVAFLAVQGHIGEAEFDNGLSGANLNGFISVDGWVLPDDIDEDGLTYDETGLYAFGFISEAYFGMRNTGDIVSERSIGKLESDAGFFGDVVAWGGGIEEVDSFGHIAGDIMAYGGIEDVSAKAGDILGDVTALADPWASTIGKIEAKADYNAVGAWVGGGIHSDIYSSGAILKVYAKGGDFGSSIVAESTLGKFKIKGGNLSGLVQADEIGKIDVKTAKRKDTGTYVGGGLIDAQIKATNGLSKLKTSAGAANLTLEAGVASKIKIGGSVVDSMFDFSVGASKIKIGGSAIDSELSADVGIAKMDVRGNWTDTSLDAQTLGKVKVRGNISSTTGPDDEIRAHTGTFKLYEMGDKYTIFDAAGLWLDGVHAYVL